MLAATSDASSRPRRPWLRIKVARFSPQPLHTNKTKIGLGGPFKPVVHLGYTLDTTEVSVDSKLGLNTSLR